MDAGSGRKKTGGWFWGHSLAPDRLLREPVKPPALKAPVEGGSWQGHDGFPGSGGPAPAACLAGWWVDRLVGALCPAAATLLTLRGRIRGVKGVGFSLYRRLLGEEGRGSARPGTGQTLGCSIRC